MSSLLAHTPNIPPEVIYLGMLRFFFVLLWLITGLTVFVLRLTYLRRLNPKLATMDAASKKNRNQTIQNQRTFLKRHFLLWLTIQIVLCFTLITDNHSYFYAGLLYFYVVALDAITVYFYDLRWNSHRLKNIQKKKVQSSIIAGDFALSPNSKYQIGADGELEPVEG